MLAIIESYNRGVPSLFYVPLYSKQLNLPRSTFADVSSNIEPDSSVIELSFGLHSVLAYHTRLSIELSLR